MTSLEQLSQPTSPLPKVTQTTAVEQARAVAEVQAAVGIVELSMADVDVTAQTDGVTAQQAFFAATFHTLVDEDLEFTFGAHAEDLDVGEQVTIVRVFFDRLTALDGQPFIESGFQLLDVGEIRGHVRTGGKTFFRDPWIQNGRTGYASPGGNAQ